MSEDRHNTLAIDIEGIVREVLSRLLTPEAAKSTDSSASSNSGTSNNGKQIVLLQRVVTLAELDGELTGASQVVVPRGAVVTPAVKDLLRQTGVALTFAANGTKTDKSNKHRLTIAVVETSYEPAGLLRAIEGEFVSVQRLAKTGLDTVIDEIAAQVARGGDLGLLLTGRTAAANCLANRQRGVRAVVAEKVSDVARAISDVGANLLVIDPAMKGIFELKQMAKAFAAPGIRQCPADLRERLG
jgi:hypothetical protein